MDNPYDGREQTAAKHFVLKRYIQALAFKILLGSPSQQISYVDAFSGPWEAKEKDFTDTSFMIAINALKEMHFQVREKRPLLKTKLLFIEKRKSSYRRLAESVAGYHMPDSGFYIYTHQGSFEESCNVILPIIDRTFAFIFIDPTGWTGYSYDVIRPVLQHTPGEVLVNFMYDHINRAAGMSDPKTVASLNPILGGPGWKDRIDRSLPGGEAVEALFREELKKSGAFKYVVSTQIRKTDADRPHFSIAYCTRSNHGLKAFRDIEYAAQREHAKIRVSVRALKSEQRTGQTSLFAANELVSNDAESIHEVTFEKASQWILKHLIESNGAVRFGGLWPRVIERFALRETDVKAICAVLAKGGIISASWKDRSSRLRTPSDRDLIQIINSAVII